MQESWLSEGSVPLPFTLSYVIAAVALPSIKAEDVTNYIQLRCEYAVEASSLLWCWSLLKIYTQNCFVSLAPIFADLPEYFAKLLTYKQLPF